MDTHTYTHKHTPLSCCCAAADCGQKNLSLSHTHAIYVIVVALGELFFSVSDWWPEAPPTPHKHQPFLVFYFRYQGRWRFVWQPLICHIFKSQSEVCSCCISNSFLSLMLSSVRVEDLQQQEMSVMFDFKPLNIKVFLVVLKLRD